MTVFVVFNIFEEMPHLPRHVDAASRVIGPDAEMIFIDGAYPDFPSSHRASADGTQGFCRDAGIYVCKPSVETAKRSAGLRVVDERAAPGDWVLMLDGDEELLDFSIPDADKQTGVIDFRRDSDEQWYPRARIYRWRPGLEFRGRHYTLFEGERMVATLTEGRADQVCAIGLHHNTLHRPERVAAKRDYYRLLQQQERAFANVL